STGIPSAYSDLPLKRMPKVTAGLRWAPVLNATKTPAKTARPQPNEISSQPPPFPLVLVSTTLPTTPTPSSMSIAVPAISYRQQVPISHNLLIVPVFSYAITLGTHRL